MPLTKSGSKILKKIKKQYGKKGKAVFYAMIREKRKGTTKWHKRQK